MVSVLSIALGVAGVLAFLLVLSVIVFMWGIHRVRPGAPKNPLAEFVPSLGEDQGRDLNLNLRFPVPGRSSG